ncbi:MAG: FHA domain-containing protein [Solirubrobacterales bacterium]|nr:FHA domain-containing protein [Solirubrobacterales bacterium]
MPHLNPTYGQSAPELQGQIALEREGNAFLVLRADSGVQKLVSLAERDRLTIGRDPSADLSLDDDAQVSRVHAELRLVGGAWVVVDDGLSTNGTFVGDERVGSRQRLEDRDLIRIGDTGILFRDPASAEGPGATVAAVGTAAAQTLTDTQRKVLVELCRPFATGEQFSTPATNREIAERVFLSVDAVKGHLRVLFERFDLTELPQNEKRARLAEQALRSGSVRASDLG